jgi:hypothetical protein
MNKKHQVKLVSISLTLYFLFVPMVQVLAQTTNTGAIEGQVFEENTTTGVPGATVTVVNEETGLTRTRLTDGSGSYLFQNLPSGFYRISATAPNFEASPNSVVSSFPVAITRVERVKPPPINLRRVGGVPPTTTQPTRPTPTQPTPTRPTPTPTTPTTTTPQAAVPPAGGVTEAEQLVNLTNASRGGNVNRRGIIALPLPGIRTFDDLAFLFPGVFPPPQAIGTNVGPGIGPGVGTSGQFSVNGLRSRSNNFTIDGSDNNDEEVGVRRQGFTSLVPQAIESVQEFQITTLLPEPQFGRSMGAQVNVVSRSGGINVHGTAYGFVTDKRLKARDPFDFTHGPAEFAVTANGARVLLDGVPLTRRNPVGDENPFTRAQYGFVIGGPIVKQKTHFFASFEHQDVNASKESHFAVPTLEERGLFGFGAAGLTVTGGQQVTNAFATSARGNAFFSLFPFPNNPNGPYRGNTFTEVLPANADGTIFSGKIDHFFNAFGNEHTFSGRYNFTDDDTILPVTGEALFSSLRALVRTQNLSLILNSSGAGNLSNQLRVSYGRTSLNFEEVRNSYLLPSSQLPNVPFLLNAPLIFNASTGGTPSLISFSGFDTETAIDTGGIDPGLGRTGTGPLGQVKISGFSPVGVDVFSFPQGRANNTYQLADTLFYSRGSHRLSLGFDIRWSHLNSFQDRNFRPLASFSGAANLNVDQNGNPVPIFNFPAGFPQVRKRFFFGTDFAAAGAATGFYQSQALTPDSTIGLRYFQNNFFLADQIRVRPNLTLTLGLRYELNTVPRDRDRRIESTFTSPDVAEFISLEKDFFGESGLERFLGGRTEIFERDDNNFAPHIAFAWDPFRDGRTSVRGGFGIYYDQIPGAVISQSRNVFPSFLTVNLAGFRSTGQPVTRLEAFNPAFIASAGTLNTFNTSLFGPNGTPALFLAAIAQGTDGASGASFVLPSADLVTPYSQHWGLSVERQLSRDFVASAAYVGTRGVHLLRQSTPNLGPNAIPRVNSIMPTSPNGFPGLIFPVFEGGVLAPFSAPGLALRPYPLLGPITIIESDADSFFHSLQLQLNKRFSKGIQVTTAYSWSHSIDEASDIFDLNGASALPQNSFDRRAERGSSNFDAPHRFSYSFVWDLPFMSDNRALGGWQISSIGQFQSGQPYTVLFCCDVNLDGNLTDRVADRSPIEFNAIGDVVGGVSDVGIAGRNNFRAPGIATIDAALIKAFRFTESRNLEFRTEFFNLFNRTHFGIPVHQLFFGGVAFEPLTNRNNYIDTRIPKRTIQFALKYNF